MPVEHLEARICELAGHLTAATCQFLLLIADFDARQGWASWEVPSCAAWLSWKCQMSSGTAREHVRVARALGKFPLIRGEFAAGRLSYAKVRALTRIAAPDTEAGLVQMATPMTASQLERFAQRLHRHDQEGGIGWDGEQPPRQPRIPVQDLADALTEVCAAYLRGKIASADNADVYQVIVHAGTQAIATEDPGPAEDPEPAKAGEPGDVSAETSDAIAPDVPAETLPVGHPAYPRRCHLDDGPAIGPATLQLIGCNATLIPTSPPLPEPRGDIAGCHPAAITPSTIIPPHSGERLDLHLAIWICLNNARNQAKRQQDLEGSGDRRLACFS